MLSFPVERNVAAIAGMSLVVDAVAALLGAPDPWLSLDSPPDWSKDSRTPIARFGHIYAARAQEFAALGFSEPHGNAPSASCRFTEVDFKLVGG